MNTEQLRQLALEGIEAKRRELDRLEAELRGDAPSPERRRRKMSAAERKAVSERMKRFWAERKRATKKAPTR